MAHNVEHGANCKPGNDHSVLYFDGSDVIFCSYFSAADAPVVYEDMMRWGPSFGWDRLSTPRYVRWRV